MYVMYFNYRSWQIESITLEADELSDVSNGVTECFISIQNSQLYFSLLLSEIPDTYYFGIRYVINRENGSKMLLKILLVFFEII